MASVRQPPEGRKAPIRPKGRKRAPLPHHFERLGAVDEHPLLDAIEQRLGHKAQERRVGDLKQEIVRLLGERSRVLFDLEVLESEIHGEREEAYFDAGYELGAALARYKSIRDASGVRYSELAAKVAGEIRDRVVQAQLSPTESTLVLLEAAWVAALGFNDDARTAGK
jgi:hypothetical protein